MWCMCNAQFPVRSALMDLHRITPMYRTQSDAVLKDILAEGDL